MVLFGDIIGKETINTEFKEFSICDEISEKMIKRIIKSKFINKKTINEFVNCVNHNLKLNFIKYIPKYIASFSNSKIDGNLYIGISDEGKYYGIPHVNLSVKLIKEMICECKKYVDHDILDNITVELINVQKNNMHDICHTSKILLNKYFDKTVFEYSKYDDYVNKKNKNLKNITKYRCKIGMVITNKQLKKECIRFVKKFCLDEMVIQKIIYDFENFNGEITSDFIQLHKNDKTHMIYWITEFRDYYTKFYTNKIFKKSHDFKILNNSPYKYIYKSMKNFIPFLIKNDYINIYVIKLIFTNVNIHNIHYKNQIDNKWKLPFRILDRNSEPMTIVLK